MSNRSVALLLAGLLALPCAAQQVPTLVADLNPTPPPAPDSDPARFFDRGGQMLFAAFTEAAGEELWITDGTTAGTRMVADLAPGAQSSAPRHFADIGGQVFFAADDGGAGRELRVTDGTAQNTGLLLDLEPGIDGSTPYGFVPFGPGRFVCIADVAVRGLEPWTVDLTGTLATSLGDLMPGPSGSGVRDVVQVGARRLFFSADDPLHGRELWVTEGAPATTRLVADLNPSAADARPTRAVASQGRLLFGGDDGMRIARQTLCDWQLLGTEALAPLVDCLLGKIRAGPVMQLDDTPVKCQAGKGLPNYQAYLWTFVNPEVSGIVYRFTPGRAGELIAKEIGDFSGYLVGDGYSGNGAGAKAAPGEIQLAGCWAHTIRKFRDARSESAKVAKLFESDIRQLYRIEGEADEASLDDAGRLELRQTKSRAVLEERLFPRAERMRDDYSDSGDMGTAIGYLVNQRTPLPRFLEDARIPLDNNSCERAIRPIAIGRRNWLFAGSERGGRAAAIAYSVIESCRRAKVDPQAYIADVLVRMATHPANRIEELLPEVWATSYGTDAVLTTAVRD